MDVAAAGANGRSGICHQATQCKRCCSRLTYAPGALTPLTILTHPPTHPPTCTCSFGSWPVILDAPWLKVLRPALRVQLGEKGVQPRAPLLLPDVNSEAELQEQSIRHARALQGLAQREASWLERRVNALVLALREEFAGIGGSSALGRAGKLAAPGAPPAQVQPPRVPQPQPTAAAPVAQEARTMASAAVLARGAAVGPTAPPDMRPRVPAAATACAAPVAPPVLPADWKARVAEMYAAMRAQLMAIKSEAGSAVSRMEQQRHKSGVGDVAKRFRSSVGELRDRAGALEALLRALLHTMQQQALVRVQQVAVGGTQVLPPQQRPRQPQQPQQLQRSQQQQTPLLPLQTIPRPPQPPQLAQAAPHGGPAAPPPQTPAGVAIEVVELLD